MDLERISSDSEEDEPFVVGSNRTQNYDRVSSERAPSFSIPPPLPLIQFDSPLLRDWTKISTVAGEIQSIANDFGTPLENIPLINKYPNSQGDLHDPVLSLALARWFSYRCRREGWWRNRDQSFSYHQDIDQKEYLASVPDSFQLAEYCVFKHSWSKSNLVAAFEDDVKFSSNFECGNLFKATRVKNRDLLMSHCPIDIMDVYAVPLPADLEYDLELRNDLFTEGNIQWYYFSATAPESSTLPVTVRINIVNMKKSDSLYNYGLRPAVGKRSDSSKIVWVHDGQDICYYKNHLTVLNPEQIKAIKLKARVSGKQPSLRYKHSLTFSYQLQPGETIFFAHSFPYTYSDLQRYLFEIESNPRISTCLTRRLLSSTIAGNRCELLTISSRADGMNEYSSNDKPVVVLTARVHPGESNSSYIMQGIIEFLVSDTPDARRLRDNFVFKIIPMLNPDGVIHGNYRCSLSGVDLNRRYENPSITFHPTIFAVRQLLTQLQTNNRIILYLDIHGHSKKQNCFSYGCDVVEQPKAKLIQVLSTMSQEDIHYRRIHARVFPRILSSLSNSSRGGYFSFQDCKFRCKKNKFGTGRVVGWSNHNIENSFTIEASFCSNGNPNISKILKRAASSVVYDCNSSTRLVMPNESALLGPTPSATTVSTASLVTTKSQCYNGSFFSRNTAVNTNARRPVEIAAGSPGMALRPSKRGDASPINGDLSAASEANDSSLEESAKVKQLILDLTTTQFYTKDDFKNMGRHICLAILHYCNLPSTELFSDIPIPVTLQNRWEASIKFTQTSELTRGAISALSEKGAFVDKLPSAFQLLDLDASTNPIMSPGVLSDFAINSLLDQSNGLQSLSLRIRSEMEIRQQFEARDCVVPTEQIVAVISDDDDALYDSDASDSDPSVDNNFAGVNVVEICSDVKSLLKTLRMTQKHPTKLKKLKRKLSGVSKTIRKGTDFGMLGNVDEKVPINTSKSNSSHAQTSVRDIDRSNLRSPQIARPVRPHSASNGSIQGPSPALPTDRQAYEFMPRKLSKERLAILSTPTASTLMTSKPVRSYSLEGEDQAPNLEVLYRTLLCGGNSLQYSGQSSVPTGQMANKNKEDVGPTGGKAFVRTTRPMIALRRPSSADPRIAALSSKQFDETFARTSSKAILSEDSIGSGYRVVNRQDSFRVQDVVRPKPQPQQQSTSLPQAQRAAMSQSSPSMQAMVHALMLNPPEFPVDNLTRPPRAVRVKQSGHSAILRDKSSSNNDILGLLSVKGIATNK